MYSELVKRLRETSKDFGEHDHVSVMLCEAANAIEELMRRCEHFQYMPLPAWIPVTERLPDNGADILAYIASEEGRIIPANYDRGVWFDCLFNCVAENATHWMPLPQPPKEA